MLEEAAGTRMYETKKEAALRTLEKKQVKVQEIEKVLLLYTFHDCVSRGNGSQNLKSWGFRNRAGRQIAVPSLPDPQSRAH